LTQRIPDRNVRRGRSVEREVTAMRDPVAPAPPTHFPSAAGDRVAPETDPQALVRRYFEVLQSGGDLALAGDLFADDYVAHDPNLPPLPPGPGGVALHVLASRTAFPDQRVTVDDLLADGDRVAVRFTFRGTHRGDLLGFAPTGRRVEVHGVAIYRIAGGRIAEGWVGFDVLGLLDQLGVLGGVAPLGQYPAKERQPPEGSAPFPPP
jgi:steroid delta-isomerase-like uncharacterized protein